MAKAKGVPKIFMDKRESEVLRVCLQAKACVTSAHKVTQTSVCTKKRCTIKLAHPKKYSKDYCKSLKTFCCTAFA